MAAIFFLATALQNSITMGQEFYQNMKKMNIMIKTTIHTKTIIEFPMTIVIITPKKNIE